MNHLSRLLLVIMVVLTTAVVATAPAAGERYGGSRSAGHWTAREAMAPLGGDPEHLFYFGTECPSATTCASLGEDDGPVARSIVAGRETVVRVLPPADSSDSNVHLALLSCASATFCVGTGYYSPPDGYRVFFTSWDGSTWRSVRAPDPPDGRHDGQAQSISCGAPDSCTAVSPRTIYTLAGGRWTAEAPLPPNGTDDLHMYRVSCASTSCVILGSAYNGSGRAPIVIVRDGAVTTTWRLPNPPGWTSEEDLPGLLGLDCAAPGHCVVEVGTTGQPTFLLTVDGTRAVYHRVPDLADADPDAYLGTASTHPISCPTVSTCWVLDTYRPRGSSVISQPKAVVFRWHDGAVGASVLPEPAPRSESRSEFRDLNCPSATSCVAVGTRLSDDNGPQYLEAVAVTLHRGIWRASLVPAPAGAPAPRTYDLTGVACGAPARCTADGEYRWDLGAEYYFAHRRQVVVRLIRR